jgi:hypothetical protein
MSMLRTIKRDWKDITLRVLFGRARLPVSVLQSVEARDALRHPWRETPWMTWGEEPFGFAVAVYVYGLLSLLALSGFVAGPMEYFARKRALRKEALRPHFEDEAHREKYKALD